MVIGGGGFGSWCCVISIDRCDLEGESEGGITLDCVEKLSKELGFEGFLRLANLHNAHAVGELFS